MGWSEGPRCIRSRPTGTGTSVTRTGAAWSRRPGCAPADLVFLAFVQEGIAELVPIQAMPGVVQHSLDTLRKAAVEAVSAGSPGSCPSGCRRTKKKDAAGTAGTDPDGIQQVALRAVEEEVGDELVVMSDLCLDEYTDHGHWGVLDEDGRVDNDATLERVGAWQLPRLGSEPQQPPPVHVDFVRLSVVSEARSISCTRDVNRPGEGVYGDPRASPLDLLGVADPGTTSGVG
ncbi:hypothetical protein [Streptomyces sp. NPDC056682]|uniref:hypothetical protein n=1 Tax=Streptomyces sp. NPDC056682 TaxID=3345909 RepID=UPI0036AB5D06